MKRILVTGGNGQIGTELVPALQDLHGAGNVVVTDIQPPSGNGPQTRFEILDVRDANAFADVVQRHDIDTVYHLASLLSARGEERPDVAWDVNMNGLRILLELARERKLRVFWPSSIAVFGPTTPRHGTPQHTVLEPNTIYGITKLSGELLCKYYHDRFGVDVRSLRFPGIISHGSAPGGGTTDYAVEVFFAAVQRRPFQCFVGPETRLPMMYMDDAVRATLQLMAADPERLSVWTAYNVAAISFTTEELVEEIRKRVPDLDVRYAPDHRQLIAATWPEEIDDAVARADWHWSHAFDLPRIVDEMLVNLTRRTASVRRAPAADE